MNAVFLLFLLLLGAVVIGVVAALVLLVVALVRGSTPRLEPEPSRSAP